jgi:S-formylglutathione hydrolase FrmB/lysophospholipase L1-like esterase
VKRLFALFVCLMLLGAGFAAKEDILTITHFSKSLHKEKTFQVYFPRDAKPGEKFPVLFVLHGVEGGCHDWVALTNVADLADNYRMILVFPDGGEFGWYVDSPLEKDSQYETYVAKELVQTVDRLFPTVARKDGRGIMGLSMGGHGALLLAAKHPDLFGSASALSGIVRITNHPEKWHIAGRLGALAENRPAWEANSVFDQADRFTTAGVRILFDCGVADTLTGAIGDARQLHDKLTTLTVPHIWREFEGTHSWGYWQGHLEEHLNFHQAAMIEATPGMGIWVAHYFKRLSQFFEENAALAIEKPASPTGRPEKPTVCLLGSSGMEGLPSRLFPGGHVFNRGIVSDTLGIGARGISHRLEESVFDMKPDFVFILNGTNDLARRQKEREPSIARMIEEYEKILLTIKTRLPKTRIVIITCYPVRDKYAHLATPIVSYNEQLKSLAKKHGVAVLDPYKKLVGEDGFLRREYSSDGLHLSPIGKELVAKMMNELIAGKTSAR